MQTATVLSVHEVTAHIRGILEDDPLLSHAWIRGELLELKRHSSGHLYFALGDEESRISCVLFRGDASRILQWPEKGDEVIVQGRVAVYEARGVYQVYVSKLMPVGKGAQTRAKKELEHALREEGLFDPRHKRPLPQYPLKVGIVTSSTGAALFDVLQVARRRFPLCCLIVIPTLVQGVEAPESIVRALGRGAKVPGLEALLLVRGGGSRDDLAAFDEERVVRAVRAFPVPVVSGIGHDVDVSLVDLAADCAGSTPSAATELLFPDQSEVGKSVAHLAFRVRTTLSDTLNEAFRESGRLAERATNAFGRHRERWEDRVGHLAESLSTSVGSRLDDADRELGLLEKTLTFLSPKRLTEMGFVLCENGRGRISTMTGLLLGDTLKIRFVDGTAFVSVQDLIPGGIE